MDQKINSGIGNERPGATGIDNQQYVNAEGTT